MHFCNSTFLFSTIRWIGRRQCYLPLTRQDHWLLQPFSKCIQAVRLWCVIWESLRSESILGQTFQTNELFGKSFCLENHGDCLHIKQFYLIWSNNNIEFLRKYTATISFNNVPLRMSSCVQRKEKTLKAIKQIKKYVVARLAMPA